MKSAMRTMNRRLIRGIGALALLLMFAGCTAMLPPETDQVVEPTVLPSDQDITATDQIAETEEVAKINLNETTEEELMTMIPDFSQRMAHEFIEYQPYISIAQFRQEIGKYVGEEQIALYEEYVFVPVNFNESDTETLKQLPGVDEAEAASLLATRPFGSREEFLEALAQYVTAEQLAQAAYYLTE